MQDGACKQEVQSRGCLAEWLGVLFAQASVHSDHKIQQIGHNHDYCMTFVVSSRGCYYSPLKRRIWYSKREPSRVLLLLLRHVVPLDDKNDRLTMPVVKGRCACVALSNTFNIGVIETKIFITHLRAYLVVTCEITWRWVCSIIKFLLWIQWYCLPPKSTQLFYNR